MPDPNKEPPIQEILDEVAKSVEIIWKTAKTEDQGKVEEPQKAEKETKENIAFEVESE